MNIVYADDNEIVVGLAKAWFKDMAMKVCIARNGMEVLKVVEERDIDLVLMDLRMPVMGGLEAAESIRHSPSVDRQPVIYILSADDVSSTKKKCSGYSVDGIWAKPTYFSEFEYLVSCGCSLAGQRME